MKILATKRDESVLCVLPDGASVEITMVSATGEDVAQEPDIQEAVKLLQRYLLTFIARKSL